MSDTVKVIMAPDLINYEATHEVQKVIRDLGRTEDIKFSPCKKKLALAAFTKGKIIVFKIHIEPGLKGPGVFISDHVIISSEHLQHPHGISFIDEETIIVANRTKSVVIFKLPPFGAPQKEFAFTPLQTIWKHGLRKLHSPGSIEVYQTDKDEYRLLICDNYAHIVTSARLYLRSNYPVRKHRILLKKSLETPDGVSVSVNRKWIAISNHTPGTVFVYKNVPSLNRKSEPAAILQGMDCPHGVRFAEGDHKIIVADAASQHLFVYANNEDEWSGIYPPYKAIEILDDQTFQRGRYNTEEGGPKGIDLTNDANVLVTTCEHQPLTFYNLNELLKV